MGDMADFAMEQMWDDDETYSRLMDVPFSEMDDCEREFMYPNYDGVMRSSPFSRQPSKPCGPGECPLCGGKTHTVKGKHGVFYGCDGFPKCKGSRNANGEVPF